MQLSCNKRCNLLYNPLQQLLGAKSAANRDLMQLGPITALLVSISVILFLIHMCVSIRQANSQRNVMLMDIDKGKAVIIPC